MGTHKHPADVVVDGLLSIKEAARFLAIGRSKLYDLMDRGALSYVKIGKARRVPKRGLAEFAAKNLRGGWDASS